MTAQPKGGIRRYASENFWVIIVDIAGFLLLVSLLMTAAGAPALKQWMFILLTAVPVMAAINILSPRREQTAQADIIPLDPPLERKIHISPRPYDQRNRQVA